MGRCLNCIHYDVCDTDRHEKERLYGDCSDFLNDTEVVPKSEVEALECEIATLKKSALPSYCQAVGEEEAIKIGKQYGKAEAAREIFEEIETILKIVKIPCINAEGYITPLRASYWAIDPNDYAELKKRYTEDSKQ